VVFVVFLDLVGFGIVIPFVAGGVVVLPVIALLVRVARGEKTGSES
jgi:hypothetical protein